MTHHLPVTTLGRARRTVGWGFPPSTQPCAFCGTPLAPGRSGRPQGFCSPTCQRLGWYREQLERVGCSGDLQRRRVYGAAAGAL